MILSPYTRFHVGIGWTAVAFGVIAILLKVPDIIPIPFSKRIRNVLAWHSVFGGGFVTCAMFMPLTANWIWPRLGTPLEIIYLIASLYIGIVVGILLIRIFKYINRDLYAKSLLSEKKIQMNSPSEVQVVSANEEGKSVKDTLLQKAKKLWNPYQDRHIWIKFLHGTVMIFSWVLMLGAGQAFLSNSRTNFPYPANSSLTDSLYGRCYARNLNTTEAPSWLTALDCGYGVVCAESTRGGPNPYA